MDDQVLWRKAYDAYETKKNGVIYKDHPYVSKVRLLIQSYETMDPEKIKPHYLPSTRFYDVMNSVPFNKSKSLEEEFKDFSYLCRSIGTHRYSRIWFPGCFRL